MQKWEYAHLSRERVHGELTVQVCFSHRAVGWIPPYDSKEGLKQFQAEIKAFYTHVGSVDTLTLHWLRRLGDDGWELVASNSEMSAMVFKRPLE